MIVLFNYGYLLNIMWYVWFIRAALQPNACWFVGLLVFQYIVHKLIYEHFVEYIWLLVEREPRITIMHNVCTFVDLICVPNDELEPTDSHDGGECKLKLNYGKLYLLAAHERLIQFVRNIHRFFVCAIVLAGRRRRYML